MESSPLSLLIAANWCFTPLRTRHCLWGDIEKHRKQETTELKYMEVVKQSQRLAWPAWFPSIPTSCSLSATKTYHHSDKAIPVPVCISLWVFPVSFPRIKSLTRSVRNKWKDGWNLGHEFFFLCFFSDEGSMTMLVWQHPSSNSRLRA